MRIAFFLKCFPAISETFILRQLTALIDDGHDVRIFSERSPDVTAAPAPMHAEVEEYDLLSRTTYLDKEMPLESGYWSMPAWPVDGETWIPGSASAIPNMKRLLDAVPVLRECLEAAPELAIQTLDPARYGWHAASLEALYHLASLLRMPGDEFDIAHAHFGPVGRSFAFVAALWNIPFVVSFHGYDFSRFPRDEGLHVYDHLFTVATAVTVNSQYTRGRVRALGCADGKMHELPVGLNPDEFAFTARSRAPGEAVRLLTVARLVEIKGHEYAIEAVRLAREVCPDLRYDIVGEGALRDRLQSLIDQSGLHDVVVIHGAMNGQDVRDMMARAHVFVLASVDVGGDQEGQGLALQEAQASGLPVIATEHGALPEGLVAGQSGFLVPERDVEALAERLAYLATHPQVWPAMGLAGRRFVVRRYDIRRLNRQLVQLYGRLIAQVPPRPRKARIQSPQHSLTKARGYWEDRYRAGGTSGSGSYGHLARFKAEVINEFVQRHAIKSVIEFGCGDGSQLSLGNYPQYIGLDVSATAIHLCATRFGADQTKSFFLYNPDCFIDNLQLFASDLALSLDVIFHLTEDQIYDTYMRHLVGAANKFMIIYASDRDEPGQAGHVKHRKFTDWIELHAGDWTLLQRLDNEYPFDPTRPEGTSFSTFFIFGRRACPLSSR